ncbi:unnamed protein product [Lactuca saligna]|uniref:Uncharacterized protein n=1 Tax=Lactuca saligna TaxID=75948 RepID=A0AA35Y6D8_LACSI|nr:unnamed protein product [Lactuca saligna]
MGKGLLTSEAQGNTSIIPTSSFETPGVDTTMSLPPFLIPTSSELPSSTHSPTFNNIIHQPITSLFHSESTNPKIVNDDATTNDGEFTGTFVDLEFDLEEENIPDHMLMIGKKFRILNRKINSFLHL